VFGDRPRVSMAGRDDGDFVSCGDTGWGGRLIGGESCGHP
jgi:hypothetical protein